MLTYIALNQVRNIDGQEEAGDQIQAVPESMETYQPGPVHSRYPNHVKLVAPEILPGLHASKISAENLLNMHSNQPHLQPLAQNQFISNGTSPWTQTSDIPDLTQMQSMGPGFMSNSSAYTVEQPWFMPNFEQWATGLLQLHQEQDFDWTGLDEDQFGIAPR